MKSHYSIDQLKEKVIQAVSTLIHHDSDMIIKGVHERTIKSRLGYYLQDSFSDRHVDCEYDLNFSSDSNKKEWSQIEDSQIYNVRKDIECLKNKINENDSNQFIKQAIKKLNQKISSYFYPDIIVHRRNSNDFNEIIIEAKKNGNDTSTDEKKIQYLLGIEPNNSVFNYRLGCLMVIIVNNGAIDKSLEIKLKFMENGQENGQEITETIISLKS